MFWFFLLQWEAKRTYESILLIGDFFFIIGFLLLIPTVICLDSIFKENKKDVGGGGRSFFMLPCFYIGCVIYIIDILFSVGLNTGI